MSMLTQHQPDSPAVANHLPNAKTRHSRSATIEFLRRLIPAPTGDNWYKRTRQGERWLLEMSEGQLVLVDNVYRTKGRMTIRHTACGSLLSASMKEIFRLGTQHICPFCNVEMADDLKRYGSVDAVRELVALMTQDCVEFSRDNSLRSNVDEYSWHCHLHGGYRFSASYARFARDPEGTCPICAFERQRLTRLIIGKE